MIALAIAAGLFFITVLDASFNVLYNRYHHLTK